MKGTTEGRVREGDASRFAPDPTEAPLEVAPAKPLVSVIIPHLNDLDRLIACLDCLRAQSFAPERMEIIVCDNGSSCGPEEVRARIGDRARVVFEPEMGAAAARNTAISVARGEILAFTDSDCLPSRDWARDGVDSLASHDIVGGRIVVSADDPDNLTPTEAFELVFAFRNRMYVKDKGFSVTASMFTRRAVFDRVGGFRQGVSEDIDWCQRALAAGFDLGYSDACRVVHPARRDEQELRRKWTRITSQTYLLARSSRGETLRWLARHWLVLGSIVPHLGVVAMTPRLRRWRDRVNAAGVLIRIRSFRFRLAHKVFFEGER